jgi:hypothetical protein
MTEPHLTISLLIENTRQHLDDLADKIPDALRDDDPAPITVILESLNGDLDAIERVLSDLQCEVQILDRLL